MQPFPLPDALPPFTGDEIVAVTIGSRLVSFRFNQAGTVNIEERLDYIAPDGTVSAYDCGAELSPPFLAHRLLFTPVSGVEREDQRLTLRFEGGAALVFHSGDAPFESGHFEDGGGDVTAVF